MLVEFFVGLFLILAVGMGVGGVRVDFLYQVLERTLGVGYVMRAVSGR